jgi:hypothetical protein
MAQSVHRKRACGIEEKWSVMGSMLARHAPLLLNRLSRGTSLLVLSAGEGLRGPNFSSPYGYIRLIKIFPRLGLVSIQSI